MRLSTMKATATLLLLALFLSSGVDSAGLGFASVSSKNPFRSPSGAMNMDISPMIDQDQTPAIPGCRDIKFEKSEVTTDSMLWPWSGLKKVTKIVYQQYLKQSEMNARTLRYKDKTEDGKQTKRRLAEAPEIDQTVELAAECIARRMLLNELPMAAAVCSCLSSQSAAGYCQLTDAFALSVGCHDNMAEQIDSTKVCPTLLTKSLGVEMSSMCSGYIAGTISALNFDLYTLNFPDSTPDQIDAKIASQEARAYYVGLKAIERFTKWTDAHLFCSAGEPNHENLKDLEILPSWESKMYFWIVEPSGRRLPIAMVAQRTPEESTSKSAKSVENTLIVIRNVRTTFEGRLFLTNQQTRKYLLADIGPVHEGYDAVASMMLPSLVQFFQKFYATAIPAHPKITTIGHGNFGAGIGAIIARDLANKFTLARSGMIIEHNFIGFEGGPVGGYEFTSELKQKVNVRNIVSDMSGFSQLPCETVKGCDRQSQIATGTVGQKFGPFLNLPGRVTVDSLHLSNDVWRTNTTQLETVAHMNCATSCWLATKFCADDPAPKCSYESCGAFITQEARDVDAI